MHKVIGTETEFGISVRGAPDFNPVLASSIVVNSYAGLRAKIQWSHEEESPGRDARGFGPEGGILPDIDGGLVNVVLGNGARFYVDHAHPEYSAPEAYDPLEATLYDKAGEVVLARAATEARSLLEEGQSLVIHKNNSDGKGNSYGSHENFLLNREMPFSDIVDYFTTFLVTRQVFTGSGKLGSENGRQSVPFQLTQRADFFEEEVGLETTLKRPIINTRDEPHGDPKKYRRLHVIIGDATMSEVQTFIKLGSAALILMAIEEGVIPDTLRLAKPVDATWQVSHDLDMNRPLELAEGGTATALELQGRYLEWAKKYAENADLPEPYEQVLREWEAVLADLERDPLSTADRLDWAAKYRLLLDYQERDELKWDDAKLRLLALQYHDVDPAKGLFYKLQEAGRIRRLFTEAEIEHAVNEPPARTRAYFRGKSVRKYGDSLVAANWDSLVFDAGEETLKRVPMMEPLRGTKELVSGLLDRSDDAASLLRALGENDE
ncbi:MAG: proteasome accessory factor PafA2 [Acidimicrobiia bacterium]|nr:proteasome accessory factor PafA2 [Acidimicrobiia bacterium]MBT8192464.1 proteasome accessory factor PafA2 [Acidimicrobiia bacterium]MBT8246546.1 proteasome accessory factor PafA2 [Acidimicrobiia bacterium]NNF89664.1 proteasome accessory factor PafA2 [Acidimicrobiia bacterium]NNL14159.1 proteasome accessory factor PafA2 [Acidimicrobiia bacterium]